jgi:tetratricopeptide (TPR) repeat protein
MKYRFSALLLALVLGLWPVADGRGSDLSELVFSGADAHYRGDLQTAAADFEAALRLSPDNAFARNQLGLVYAKQQQWTRAMAQFRQVAQMDRDNTFARLWIGILHLQSGNLAEARAAFETVLAIDPDNADACYFLGTLHYIDRDPAEAIRFLKRARDADSQEPETHYRLARAFDNVDMIDNARLEYLRTLALKPTHTGALNDLGWLQYNRGLTQEAIALWKETLRINPKDRDAVLNLARVYNEQAFAAIRAGDAGAAMALWQKTLAVHPTDKAAAYYLSKYSKNGKGLQRPTRPK